MGRDGQAACSCDGAWAEGYAIATRGGLQRPEGAGLVRVGVGQVRLALLFDQQPQTGEQTHRAGDDLVQHRLQRFIGWRRYRDVFRRAVGTLSGHAIQHQAVQVNVEIGRGPKALDQRDGAAVGLVCFAPWRRGRGAAPRTGRGRFDPMDVVPVDVKDGVFEFGRVVH